VNRLELSGRPHEGGSLALLSKRDIMCGGTGGRRVRTGYKGGWLNGDLIYLTAGNFAILGGGGAHGGGCGSIEK